MQRGRAALNRAPSAFGAYAKKRRRPQKDRDEEPKDSRPMRHELATL